MGISEYELDQCEFERWSGFRSDAGEWIFDDEVQVIEYR